MLSGKIEFRVSSPGLSSNSQTTGAVAYSRHRERRSAPCSLNTWPPQSQGRRWRGVKAWGILSILRWSNHHRAAPATTEEKDYRSFRFELIWDFGILKIGSSAQLQRGLPSPVIRWSALERPSETSTWLGRNVASGGALRHKSGSSSFTYYAVEALQYKTRRYEHTRTVFGAITKKQFEALATVEPPVAVVDSFGTWGLLLDEQTQLDVVESRTLATLWDVLLPKLVSGEVGVAQTL